MLHQGGNFWDLRATGLRCSPFAMQTHGPAPQSAGNGKPRSGLCRPPDIATPVPGVVRERLGAKGVRRTWPGHRIRSAANLTSSPSSAIGSEVPRPEPCVGHFSHLVRRIGQEFDRPSIRMGESTQAAFEASPEVSPILLQIRRFSGEQDRAHGDRTSRLRSVQRSGQMHKLSRG